MLMREKAIQNLNKYQHNQYLEKRLTHWGKWYIKYVTHGIGYASRSTEGRLKDDGGVLSRSTKPPEPPANLDAEEMDTLINALGISYPLCAQVIRMHYASLSKLDYEIKKNSYDKKTEHYQDLSYGSYRSNLRLAKMWLLGRLGR